MFGVNDDDNVYLAVGSAFSGTQFHHHSDGWNAQIFGKKHWLLYPPNEMPPLHYPPIHIGVSWWLRQFAPVLKAQEQPISCTVD